MKKILGLALALMLVGNSHAQLFGRKSKKEDTKSLVKTGKDEYQKLLKGAETKKGLFRIHIKDGKYYMEIADSLLEKDMLLTSRVSAISNNKDVSAGQMPKDPLLVKWSRDNEQVYLKNIITNEICDPSEAIYDSYKRNHLEPIMHSFKIKAFTKDSSSVVIEVGPFFKGNEKVLNPFMEKSVLDMIFGTSKLSGKYDKNASVILYAKAFSKNINIRSQLVYTVNGEPFTAELTRGIVLLPENPMKSRLSDQRIGYFRTSKKKFTEKEDKVVKLSYINRWRIEPKPEDQAAYDRGELVEPAKPIVYYVDNSFPEKWKKYIKLGIEDWQKAFEAIGFKNAIVAKDYPKNNEDFDPDDLNYSCFKYISTTTQNAMGPSHVDPRSGEILCGDVLFYHNVIKLLHDWRFVQTAAVDPRVRKDVFDEEVMGESIRYVAAHEIGHTLGLMHNMGASYSYPTDSLRSKSFTKKYGTTPSIMDYARNNYVAQPGDDAYLVPPLLGIYDYFAIKWGYKPIEGNEKETLNKWILDVKDNKMLWYGPQQFLSVIDPSSLSEALGDDAVKASTYGIQNTKVIMKNLVDWTTSDGEDYSDLRNMYKELFIQYNRYIGHVKEYLGGVYLYKPVKGEEAKSYVYVSKAKQKEALNWILDEIYDLPNWFYDMNIIHRLDYDNNVIAKYQGTIVRGLMSSGILAPLANFEKEDPKHAYTQAEYLGDIYDYVWKKTKQGRKLDYYDRQIQYNYVKGLLKAGNYQTSEKSGKKKLAFWESDAKACSCEACQHEYLVSLNKEADAKVNVRSIVYGQLKELHKLLKNARYQNKADRYHYEHIAKEIKFVLKL